MRPDGRQADELRPISLTPHAAPYAEGSVLIALGNTRVLCTATVEESLPRWMEQEGREGGWITAEYAMLPRATQTRTPRTNWQSSRSQEIRRLIGRSLRAAFDLSLLGRRSITVDADVLQADGGTRTAAITGGYVAVALALRPLIAAEEIPAEVFRSPLAAVSVGVVDGVPMLDLCYAEDLHAEVDMNVVMDAQGRIVEIQGTAEGAPFSRATHERLLDLAWSGIQRLLAAQRKVLEE
ncbi:MAG TPA: ribonuclease PH [Anaerolineae bacterium]|nr:ribonuclease PH [Anaerolineae bacterium]HID85559.1 ribonuclease PH [Anaerolineales bacterium]HIQ08447.1 ribonuclease PH [Anaerolineaceae bacterium]